MAWNSSSTKIGYQWYLDWQFSSSRMQIVPGRNPNSLYTLSYTDVSYNWNSKKTYQFNTKVKELYLLTASFSVQSNWGERFNYYSGASSSNPIPTDPSSGDFYTQSYIFYSTPPSSVSSNKYLTITTNGTFSSAGVRNEGIVGLDTSELDFSIQGYSYYKLVGRELEEAGGAGSLGWYYSKSNDYYYWYDKISGSPSSYIAASTRGYHPVGGSYNNRTSNVGYRLNNYISRFVPYTYFNLSFQYQNVSNHPLKIYLSPNLPTSSPANWNELVLGSMSQPSGSKLIAVLTQSVPIVHNFYGLKGNQYIYIVGGFAGASASVPSGTGTTYSSIYLSNLKIDGGYHLGNNRQYVMNNYSTYSVPTGLTGATYSAYVGSGNTVNATSSLSISQIFSKLGNGAFKAGIWENGVWNSGWRVDEGVYEFTNILQFFSYNTDKRWRIQIQGPALSVSKFEIGDNVSIGNIVAIDINEERRLLKGYFTIINKIDNSIVVEFDNNFPLRRIEKDSDNHRIYVTKNVWLSGGFLNGYFKGIWNYGLFKGYPLITEMHDSHWIDGIFDGGRFSTSKYTVPNFTDTAFSSGYVGLVFATTSTPHGLSVGDLITIDKDDKNINPEYDGDHYILQVVNDYKIVTDIEWGEDSKYESGKITIDLSKGLIQKFNFKSNNRSKTTSVQSLRSDNVFVFDSWIDVNYSDQSAVNIHKPQNLLNSLSLKSYSENNLYGYPTFDVLESDSTFRDSFSTTIRKYRLGTKYKIFNDFVGDAGEFEDYFGGTSSDEKSFINQGWTFSKSFVGGLTFSRTEDTGIYPLIGEELIVKSIGNGGILDVTPTSEVPVINKSYEIIQKNRYTKVDFDLVTYSNTGIPALDITNKYAISSFPGLINNAGDPVVDNNGYVNYNPIFNKIPNTLFDNFSNLLGGFGGSNGESYFGVSVVPNINFDNINIVKRDIYYSLDSVTVSTFVDATFLPIYKNVNHLNTKKTSKTEYFFNKRNLGMRFYGNNNWGIGSLDITNAEYIIDNLHFYEVDMIPFFQYFTEDNINKGIQIPFQGLSPFIDYSNSNFNFVDNISIGLDSIQTQASNTPVSGVGIGITSPAPGGIFTIMEQLAPPNLFLLDPGAVFSPSDIRLKTSINKIGVSNSGINIYEFRFINQPNDLYQGVIAQELIKTEFESSIKIESDGYYHVDYSKLDVEFKKIN
jgi:hypothetical protein